MAKHLDAIQPEREGQNAGKVSHPVLHAVQDRLRQTSLPKGIVVGGALSLNVLPHSGGGLVKLRVSLQQGNLLLDGNNVELFDGGKTGPVPPEPGPLTNRAGVILVLVVLGRVQLREHMTVVTAHVPLITLHFNPQQLEQEVLGPGDAVGSWKDEREDLQEMLKGLHCDLVVDAILHDEEKAGLEGVWAAGVGRLGEARVLKANLPHNVAIAVAVSRSHGSGRARRSLVGVLVLRVGASMHRAII